MNIPPPRLLGVWLDTLLVGRLSEQDNIWTFEYDAQWQGAGPINDMPGQLA